MNKEAVWIYVSSAWSEIGLNDQEYLDGIKKINASREDIPLIKKEIFYKTCGTFALDVLLIFLTFGMAAPDWGFDENYVINKVKKWEKKKILFSLINPLWIIGYCLACLTAYPAWRKAKKSILKN